MSRRRAGLGRQGRARFASDVARRLAGLGAAIAPLLAPLPSLAQPGESVEVVISAIVPQRCRFGAPPRVEAPTLDLDSAQAFELVLPIDCNTPFAVAVRAEHGRLVNVSSAPDGSGYDFDKVYGVRLALRTDQGLVRSERCPSTEIARDGLCAFAEDRPGEGLSSGPGLALPGEATLAIDWSGQAAEGRRLAAGDYRDTITLTLGART